MPGAPESRVTREAARARERGGDCTKNCRSSPPLCCSGLRSPGVVCAGESAVRGRTPQRRRFQLCQNTEEGRAGGGKAAAVDPAADRSRCRNGWRAPVDDVSSRAAKPNAVPTQRRLATAQEASLSKHSTPSSPQRGMSITCRFALLASPSCPRVQRPDAVIAESTKQRKEMRTGTTHTNARSGDV